MSRLQQKNFLERLRDELNAKNGSEDFRKLTGEKLSHDFSITKESLEKALYEATVRVAEDSGEQNIKITKKDAKEWVSQTFEGDIETFISSVKTNIEKYSLPKGLEIIIEPESNKHSLKVKFNVSSRNTSLNVFNIIKRLYNSPLTTLYNAFIDKVKKKLNLSSLQYKTVKKEKGMPQEIVAKDITRGFVFQLEHVNSGESISSNIDLFIAQSFNKTNRGRLTKAQATKIMLGIDKDLNLDKPSVATVFLGSGIANRREAPAEQARRTELLKKVNKAIKRLCEKNAVPIAQDAGSDSLVETKRKAAIKEIDKAFAKRKRVKSSFKESSKLDKKGTEKPVTLDVTPKIKKATKKSYKTPKAKKVSLRPSRQTFNSLTFLIGILNQQLPQAVAENMGSPRLNYQTGRFASSVRVTDIATTAKGFPSIGYTYMKYPYQTFEPGYQQGSVERDPRKLIDRSIRDIAADFAIGRFYTRRV